jgi:hypothetical protein
VERYAKAIVEPDADKWKTYISDLNFYDSGDPVLLIAKGLRAGGNISGDELETTLAAANGNHYAQALIKAYEYVITASDFFTKGMETEELMDRFDIGRMGPEGIIV